MKSLFKFFSKLFGAERTISESAKLMENIFDNNSEEQVFFDNVFAHFKHYDESNQGQDNGHFSADIEFIIHCTTTSLTSSEYQKLFSRRVDGYFYIYRRLIEYINLDRECREQMKELQKELHLQLVSTFESTKGCEPNLVIRDRDLLQRMNIRQHLMSIAEINDTRTLQIFFVFCKLSFQSSLIVDDNNHLQWFDIFSTMHRCTLSLEHIISQYTAYKNAFERFPLDMRAFIYLIRTMHPPKNNQTSPFELFIKMIDQISFDHKTFFEQFHVVFIDNQRRQLYDSTHIAGLLHLLSTHDERLCNLYSSSLNDVILWNILLFLTKNSDINEIIQRNFGSILSHRIQTSSFETFHWYHKSANEFFKSNKIENRPHFWKLFEQIFHAFINKQLTDDQYSHRLSEQNLKSLLSVNQELSSTNNLQNSSYFLLVRHLLFKVDRHIPKKSIKMKNLFERSHKFNQELCQTNDPANIIQDEWLNDYVFLLPQEWLEIYKSYYRDLCNAHHNNPWSIYIWSRIIHLSFIKSDAEKPNEILTSLTRWMKEVQHDTYDANDTLTIIFVKNAFELLIAKHMKSVLSLSNINLIIQYVLRLKLEKPELINIKLVDDFVEYVKHSIQDILLLKGTRTMYFQLSSESIVYHFLSEIDVKTILSAQNPLQYTFPITTPQIDAIVSTEKPSDIDTTKLEPKDEYFLRFVQQVQTWLQWFDRFIDIFQYIIEYFKNWKLDGAEQLFSEIYHIRNDSTTTVSATKTIIQKILKVLQPFKDLERLCDLLNCVQCFETIGDATLSSPDRFKAYLTELQNQHPHNTFVANLKTQTEKIFPIKDRQHVHWSFACTQHHCNIKVEYRINESHNQNYELFCKKDIPIDKQFLEGEFKTHRGGQLVVIIDSQTYNAQRIMWYRLKQNNLSTCHLFQGIVSMYHQRYVDQSVPFINEKELSGLISRVFSFIDKLLDGETTLEEMNHLKTVFHDKNIDVREEVLKLFDNRLISNKKSEATTTDITSQSVEQVCEWLRTYQVYSHLSIIIDCVRLFNIVFNSDENDQSIDHLKEMIINENCSLKEMSKTYKELYERFQKLSNHHLRLIKLIVECSNVVDMMKKFDLYSTHGLRRFQELRDNLTTQFQLQERNNLILNSWIVAYALCEPFANQVQSLEAFVDNVSRLSNIDESSLEHIKVVNDNLQIVTMWLSAEGATMLDNALITMEHLYRTGILTIGLKRLINEQSYFEIEYSIDKMTTQVNSENNPDSDEEVEDDIKESREKFKYKLSAPDIDDHKRQLTFCNVDLQQKMIYKKLLLNEQLKLLQIIEKIYSILLKLEIAGHPNFQLKENHYDIYDRYGRLTKILSDLKNNPETHEQQLKELIQDRTKDFESTYRGFQTEYDKWIKDLEKYRHESRLLKLFSNHQVMIMILLLTTPSHQTPIQRKFLEKLFSIKGLDNHKDEQFKLTIFCLIHYLQSLRINECDLSIDHITTLYKKYQLEQGSSTETSLKQLSLFLKEVFNNGKELFIKNATTNENQQYLIILNSPERTTDRIQIENNFDTDTCCILLNIFNDRLPADYQILWCSNATEDDIRLFFSRVHTFRYLTFAVMNIDQMHHRLRQLLLNEQDLLAKQSEPHAPIYYFSRELTLCRKGLRPFYITPRHRNPAQAYSQLLALLRGKNLPLSQIQIIYGAAGIGKTHRIKTKYKDQNTSCVSINDKIDLSSLISSFVSFESKSSNQQQSSIYFNISIHAPFEQLNHLFFSLFICGSLNDLSSGLTFSSSITKPWKFIIEVPYTDKSKLTIQDNFKRILPVLAIISPNTLEEVTGSNYQLFIDEEEKLIARFLKAYENETIDTCMVAATRRHEKEKPVDFEPLTDHDECRQYIYSCIEKYAPELPRNKIFELSFTKFLYRRIRFFTGFYYRFNVEFPCLGSTTMKQMIAEAKALTQIDFSAGNYLRVYLVYDPDFSLYLLHNDWNKVPDTLRALFDNFNPSKRPEFRNQNYFINCLSWLINISYKTFVQLMDEKKFILTENFAYKLFHIHERKLTKLALIIEGETGVGKTFLLNFYSSLLNSNIIYGSLDNDISPRVLERTSLWLRTDVISGILERQPELLNRFLQRIESKLRGDDEEGMNLIQFDQEQDDSIDEDLLEEIKLSLGECKYNSTVLRRIWKTILTLSNDASNATTKQLMAALYNFVISRLTVSPLIKLSTQLVKLLEQVSVSTIETSIEIFDEFLMHSGIKPLFYRLLVHPGVTEEQIENFITPISQLAEQIPSIEFVVFFDEVNTSSCLSLFKEMFMDGTLHGRNLPKNIFFTAAINPSIEHNDDTQVHRRDYLVHQLPQSLENLKVSYGILDRSTLEHYVRQKIATFTVMSSSDSQKPVPLVDYARNILAESILKAQNFCETRLGKNAVSQREIQRCFNLIDFFWSMKYDQEDNEPDAIRCIALSLALIYYFRLPTKEDNSQRNDQTTPSREELGELLSHCIPDFVQTIQNELERFVNTDNFVIPHGVAVNQAIREHIFAIVVSIVTRTPLCIIGAPGQSKTLSFQIVLQNLQGSQLSTKPFCKRLPALDPFFCLGSKYSRSEDIASVFERAIQREQQYQQSRIETRCVVFLDEASLPDEKKMVLKVLHPYLDECKVAFVAVANKSFDAANANRMICIYRSLPSSDDQKILAYGCLGLPTTDGQSRARKQLDDLIYGLCQGYRQVLTSPMIPHVFHDRDFIYMLRELRFELPSSEEDQETSINHIKPISLLRALEDNFNGIQQKEFEELVKIFFTCMEEKSPNFRLPFERREENLYRDIPTILHESMKLDSKRRRLYGRYKLIIDESEDESAINLLLQTGILNTDPNQTTVFRMSDFSDDVDNELRNVEILSTIKLCMETGKTILMVNTSRIHGSLYDVFNQNFSIMATGDTRKIFSKVAIGPKTIDVVVHEDFQCIVHVKRSELEDIPAPFLSRFQKYSLSINDFYRIRTQRLSNTDQIILKNIEDKAQSFIQHFGPQYFYGLNESTLYSCLLPLIKINENGEHSLSSVYQSYTQMTMKLKSFIEHNPADVQQCILRLVLSKLIQLVSPESIILKLPTFEAEVGQWLCQLYFQQQEHFSIESFIQQFTSNALIDVGSDDSVHQMTQNPIHITTKAVIFTRTSSYVLSLNQQSKNELFNNTNDNHDHHRNRIDILNLGTIENSVELQERFDGYQNDRNKSVLLIVIDGRIGQQRLHIPFVRQLIDKTEYACNTNNQTERKSFLLLVHSPARDLYHRSCFPSIFLHHWDFYFFDTCASGSAFHLQKMLQILCSSSHHRKHDLDNDLCDLNILFEDCLWDFCSRIQIILPELSRDLFTDQMAYEFYRRQTNTIRRVQCIKQILRRASQLQKHIVDIYHEHLMSKKNSSEKIYKLIYEISKDILCGKRFDGLIDSIQSQTQNSFTNFVSTIFKFIVNDYGLETLTKLSNDYQSYGSLLNLIDYQSFVVQDDQEIFSSATTQGIFQLVTHYSCVPQTPLYHLLHQRIKGHADAIKLTLILRQTEHGDGLRRDYYAGPPVTTVDHNYEMENQPTQHTFEEFRFQLSQSLMNDKVLSEIISERLLHSYSNDLVRTSCTIVESNFHDDHTQRQQTIEFISRWLLLIDENDRQSLDRFPNRDIWLLAHVYTAIEYEQNDLLSMYSACRIIDRLDPKRKSYSNLFNGENITRSDVRETFFRLIFDCLWQTLREICSKNENNQAWIYTYTFITKYYPSDRVLQSTQLIDIKSQIEFMNLAYLIFLNDKTPEPQELISNLLKETKFDRKPVCCLKLLPELIRTIDRFFEQKNLDPSTLIIDLQQWILSMIKTNSQEINFLFQYLNQSTCQLSLGMKQFLFDELINISLKFKQPNRSNLDIWDRLDLISTIIECASDLEEYRIPYHPAVDHDVQTQSVLLDLYFFHLRRQLMNETITQALLNKGMLLKLPKIENRRLKPFAENLFKQLKDYFRTKMIALLLSQSNLTEEDKADIDRMLSVIITELLLIDEPPIKLNNHLQLFLSTIISKQSWNYLLNFLQSENLQHSNHQWATTLYDLLKLKQKSRQNKYLQLHHQIQFTLSPQNHSSIFPKLHQPYEELRVIIDLCARNNTGDDQWNILFDWITLKLNSDPNELECNEIKVMLLLIIYYEYYCNNQLSSIDSLLQIIEDTLQLSPEELRVFRVFIRPEEFMIGYSNIHKNYLNNLFRPDCEDEFELTLRHMLVNLLAMILFGGTGSFLWTFVFQPSNLQNTFGFGSTAHNIIQEHSVHYDCGCIISQNGDLIRYSSKGNISVLNVPAIYVVYFSTFGALAWHLLLFDTSVENLHGPILTPSAIADARPAYLLAGENTRAKVCQFVCTRLLSTYHFLSTQLNQNDACILLTRCFEQMAYLTQNRTRWIKSIYKTLNELQKAEEQYQNKVFYFVHERLMEYKNYINQLNLQSDIQKHLQNFIDQMPMVIQFTHFKTELHHPRVSTLSLRILQHVLNSFDFLKITHLIYDLSQFYLLLHQTYSQLIERDEFLTITLKQLYDRGQKYHQNENKPYREIIEKGITAVNTYHQFADGLIRPGACDETQRFTPISFETPVHYLVTTENHDEGDIIMRILSVLVDYHNDLIDLLEKEVNSDQNHTNGVLKVLVNELVSKQVSIIKVASDHTGVVTLSEKDCSWIEQLSQASLKTDGEQYFLTSNSRLTFDFSFVQAQIIRTYLLLCRINYQHISQKYQCHRRTQATTTTTTESLDLDEKYLRLLNDDQVENEWMYLKEMLLDKLYHSHNLIRQIALTLKNNPDDLSAISLFELVRRTDNENNLHVQLEQYEIKDFQLCYINHVLKLYAESMNHFQNSFIDVPALLRVPLKPQLNDELIRSFNENLITKEDNQIQSAIQTITELLDELKTIEDTLLQQSAQSLTETCEHLAIENPILSWIPKEIKCENYVTLNIHLIRTRSILQERKMNIEEKEMKLWDENFRSDDHQEIEASIFHQYINLSNEEPALDGEEEENMNEPGDWTLPSMDADDSKIEVEEEEEEEEEEEDHIGYSSVMELNLKLVPWTSSTLIRQIQTYREEAQSEPIAITKALKFTVFQSDGKTMTYLWRIEKRFEKLKEFFDPNVFAVVDKDQIYVDITKSDHLSTHPISLEYRIIEKQLLIQIQFQFRKQTFEYFTISKCNISTIIRRFVDDNRLRSLASDTVLCFLDEYGKCIDDGLIADVYPTNSKTIILSVLEETGRAKTFCAVTSRNKGGSQNDQVFHPATTWQQINRWLASKMNVPVDHYAFVMKDQSTILNDNQAISLVCDQNESITIDIVNRTTTTKVIFSCQTNSQCVYAFKSMKISSLLKSEDLRRQLDLSDNYLLAFGETNEQILTENDLEQPVSKYCTAEDQSSIHFRISLFVQITKYDDQEQMKILLPNRDTTIEQVLQLTGKSRDLYKYLALDATKRVLDSNEIVANVNGEKLILVRENETCLVSIIKSDHGDDENEKNQRFAVFASIMDIRKENQMDISQQYLLCANDFVPSVETQLNSLRLKSPIRFQVIEDNLPITITLQNKETNQQITFNGSLSMTAERICAIAGQFFGSSGESYQLTQDHSTLIDDDLSLEDIDQTATEFRFQVTFITSMHCSVKFLEEIVAIPCDKDTLLLTIVTEAIKKLQIPQGELGQYELILLDDDQTRIDMDTSIDDIRELFSSAITAIPLELKKKDQ